MNQVISHVSSLDKSRVLTKIPAGTFTPCGAAPDENSIVLDPSKKSQPILGFGGNWTDTDVYNLLRMSESEQDKVLELLFDPDRGAGWSFMRVPFGSTDWERNFDLYTYDDMPEGEEDPELKHFSVQRDIDRGFFKLLRRVKARYPDVELLATVWGLPGWMKNNDSIIGGIFRPECAEVYARYLRLAVEAFAKEGIELYAVTTQNEPMSSDFPNNNRGTPCTRFTWRLQRPVLLALRKEFDSHGISTRIWAYDHNYDMTEIFVDPLLRDEEVRSAIDGVAFHPYRGDPAVLAKYTAMYPDMPLYSTEKSVYDPAGMDELLRQLRFGARCYILWSFFEDSYGGPHELAGSALKYTASRRGAANEGLINNHPADGDDWQTGCSYGLFAQFSKFLRRGMRQIECSYGHPKWITAAAFQDGDGSIALVAVNQSGADQSFALHCGGKALCCGVPAMSVATFEFEPDGDMKNAPAPGPAPEKKFYEPPMWDLAAEDLSFEGEAKAGEELRFTIKAVNRGDASTPKNASASIDILLDGDHRIARIYATIPELEPGGSVTLRANSPVYDVSGSGCKSTWTAAPGWHSFMALMNVGNCWPPEKNEYNNRCCGEFFIREG